MKLSYVFLSKIFLSLLLFPNLSSAKTVLDLQCTPEKLLDYGDASLEVNCHEFGTFGTDSENKYNGSGYAANDTKFETFSIQIYHPERKNYTTFTFDNLKGHNIKSLIENFTTSKIKKLMEDNTPENQPITHEFNEYDLTSARLTNLGMNNSGVKIYKTHNKKDGVAINYPGPYGDPPTKTEQKHNHKKLNNLLGSRKIRTENTPDKDVQTLDQTLANNAQDAEKIILDHGKYRCRSSSIQEVNITPDGGFSFSLGKESSSGYFPGIIKVFGKTKSSTTTTIIPGITQTQYTVEVTPGPEYNHIKTEFTFIADFADAFTIIHPITSIKIKDTNNTAEFNSSNREEIGCVWVGRKY